jgi:uncharacterized protein YkwD
MKTQITLLLLFISSLSFSQNQNKIDLEKLKTKVVQLINEERTKNGRKEFDLDTHLEKAADDHVKYLRKIKTLSHEQSNSKKKTPKDRVYFYSTNSYTLIGENILFTGIKDHVYSNADLDALALKIFNLWKNSPSHYKNILDVKYTSTAICLNIDWQDKRIYAVQIFGAIEK